MDNEKPIDGSIDQETADREFSRFAAAWDISEDFETMGAEDRESFETQKRKITLAIMEGRATVDHDGNIDYVLKYPSGALTELKFSRPKGLAYLAMDDYKNQQSMKKLFAFIGVVTGQPVKFLGTLDGVDAKFAIGVVTLFLAS